MKRIEALREVLVRDEQGANLLSDTLGDIPPYLAVTPRHIWQQKKKKDRKKSPLSRARSTTFPSYVNGNFVTILYSSMTVIDLKLPEVSCCKLSVL